MWRSAIICAAVCALMLMASLFIGHAAWPGSTFGSKMMAWKASREGVSLPLDLLQLEGRIFHDEDNKRLQFEWSATSIRAKFRGTSIAMEVEVLLGRRDIFAVLLDGTLSTNVSVKGDGSGPHLVTLATNLQPDVDHEVCITKVTEPQLAATALTGFDLGANGRWLQRPAARERRIEVIGDSITCGFGVECANGTEKDPYLELENAYKSYASIAGRALSAEVRILAWSGKGLLQNGDGSRNATMPDLMDCVLPRLRPLLSAVGDGWQADAVVINLLTNDLAPAHQDSTKARSDAFKALIDRVRDQYAGALVVLLLGPMIDNDWPPSRTGDLNLMRTLLRAVAASYPSRVVFAEFPEQSSRPDIPEGCSGHPGAKMHKIMAQILEDTLRQQLNW